jgi:hypothetical protein
MTFDNFTDELLEEILVDAYGEDEQLWAFRQVIEDEVSLPTEGAVIGEAVQVTQIDYDGERPAANHVSHRNKAATRPEFHGRSNRISGRKPQQATSQSVLQFIHHRDPLLLATAPERVKSWIVRRVSSVKYVLPSRQESAISCMSALKSQSAMPSLSACCFASPVQPHVTMTLV